MKRNLMMAGVALLVFACGLVGAAAKANFSGTWTLDKSKSEGLPPALLELQNDGHHCQEQVASDVVLASE